MKTITVRYSLAGIHVGEGWHNHSLAQTKLLFEREVTSRLKSHFQDANICFDIDDDLSPSAYEFDSLLSDEENEINGIIQAVLDSAFTNPMYVKV